MIETKSGRQLCYSCYQDDETGDSLLMWIPEDPENWPQTCEECGGVMMSHDGPFVPKNDLPLEG